MSPRRTFAQHLNRSLIKGGVAMALASFTWAAITLNTPSEVEQSDPTVNVCVAEQANNYCAPVNHPAVLAEVAAQEDGGLKCGAAPALTDTIVFQYRDNSVEVVTFDQALKNGEESIGWIQAYCVKAK